MMKSESPVWQAVSNFQIRIQQTVSCDRLLSSIRSSLQPNSRRGMNSNHFVALLLSSDSLIRYSSIESPHIVVGTFSIAEFFYPQVSGRTPAGFA